MFQGSRVVCARRLFNKGHQIVDGDAILDATVWCNLFAVLIDGEEQFIINPHCIQIVCRANVESSIDTSCYRIWQRLPARAHLIPFRQICDMCRVPIDTIEMVLDRLLDCPVGLDIWNMYHTAVTNACRFDCIKHGIEMIEQCLVYSKPKRSFDVLKPCGEHMIVAVIEFACLTFHPQCKLPVVSVGCVASRLHHRTDKWYQ